MTNSRDTINKAAQPSTIGPYRLGEPIRTSLFSALYQAEDTLRKTQVHLRVLLPWIASGLRDPALVEERLVRLRMLNHPGILKVLDGGVDQGQIYMAVQPTDSKTLEEVLAATGFNYDALPVVMQEIAEAVEYLHQSEIYHGYLNSSNVFFNREGLIQIGDVEVAHVLANARFSPHYIPTTVRSFIAPEVLAGDRPDCLADIYSIGAILNDIINSFSDSLDIPRDARDVLWQAMDEDRAQRHRSVGALRAQFLAALNPQKFAASPAPETVIANPPLRFENDMNVVRGKNKNWIKMALPAAALSLLIIVIGFVAIFQGDNELSEQKTADAATNFAAINDADLIQRDPKNSGGELDSGDDTVNRGNIQRDLTTIDANSQTRAALNPISSGVTAATPPEIAPFALPGQAELSPVQIEPASYQSTAYPQNSSANSPQESNLNSAVNEPNVRFFADNPFDSGAGQFGEPTGTQPVGQQSRPMFDPETGVLITQKPQSGRSGWNPVPQLPNFILTPSKQITVIFFDDGSAKADRLYRLFLLDEELARGLEHTIRYTEQPQGARALARRYNINEYPMIVVLDPNLDMIADFQAEVTAAELALTLKMSSQLIKK